MSAPGANSAVATENEHASKAGLAMLKAGGSAVDAIIAAQLVVGVIQSFVSHDPGFSHLQCLTANLRSQQMSGIGGGGFSLIRTPQGEYSTYDFRVESSVSACFQLRFLQVSAE